MKWKDLSLKERKQIYDSVRVNNPDATYLDIKEQFDSIPAYEDGKGKTIVDEVNKSDANFVQRLKSPTRQTIPNWADQLGLFDAAGSRTYLLNPTEAKSHMLTLKRSLKDSGKITNWSTPVDEKMILEYMRNPTSNKMVKNQYDLYRNKNEYIDRLNKLIPMEILMPLGGAGFAGYELNKE